MAWIKMIEEAEVTGKLKQIYDSQRRQAGALANILKIHSLARRRCQATSAYTSPLCTRRRNCLGHSSR
jgi:hypothetical protein